MANPIWGNAPEYKHEEPVHGLEGWGLVIGLGLMAALGVIALATLVIGVGA